MSFDGIQKTRHRWEIARLYNDWTSYGTRDLLVFPDCTISLWLRTVTHGDNLFLEGMLRKTVHTSVKAILNIKHPCYAEKEKTINYWTESCHLPSLKWIDRGRRIKFDCDITWFLDHPFLINYGVGPWNTTNRYYMNPDLSDIVIVVGNKEIPAHKMILAGCSSVLSSMIDVLTACETADRLAIEDVSFDTMKIILEFMYNGSLSYDTPVNVEVLAAAERFAIQHLKKICEYELFKKLTIENVFEIFRAAEKHQAPTLKHQCVLFIYAKRKNLVDSPLFDQFWHNKHELMREFLKKMIREQ